MTIGEVATLLATAPMSDEERRRWIDALPILPQSVLLALGRCMEKEQGEIAAIRARYTAKAQAIIDKAKAARAKATLH